jgi:dTDP-4-amino-4,6-dideoxygalactose transaminase
MSAWRRLPPAGDPIDAAERRDARAEPDPERALREGLRDWLGAEEIQLFRSGRAALRELLRFLAARSGRSEVAIPAYCCFSVPAAAVAAGLRVRLLEVDARGRIDAGALAGVPLDRAAALLVGNLFGLAEPAAGLRTIAQRAGAALIDDAAQALGAEAADGRAGARGDVGLLSFGRGKPLSGLGGGALAWPRAPGKLAAPPAPPPARRAAQLRALAYDAALRPELFRWLAALPGLHIGETPFEPGFETGAIDGAALALAAARTRRFIALAARRAERAEALASLLRTGTRFLPLTAEPGTRGVYPRLAVLAPDAQARSRALARVAGLGASGYYPSALGAIPALRPHLAGPGRPPAADDLAARLLTLPTHAGADEGVRARIAEQLAGL